MVKPGRPRDQFPLDRLSPAVDLQHHGLEEIFVGVEGADKGGLHPERECIFPERHADDAAVSRIAFDPDDGPLGPVRFHGNGPFPVGTESAEMPPRRRGFQPVFTFARAWIVEEELRRNPGAAFFTGKFIAKERPLLRKGYLDLAVRKDPVFRTTSLRFPSMRT